MTKLMYQQLKICNFGEKEVYFNFKTWTEEENFKQVIGWLNTITARLHEQDKKARHACTPILSLPRPIVPVRGDPRDAIFRLVFRCAINSNPLKFGVISAPYFYLCKPQNGLLFYPNSLEFEIIFPILNEAGKKGKIPATPVESINSVRRKVGSATRHRETLESVQCSSDERLPKFYENYYLLGLQEVTWSKFFVQEPDSRCYCRTDRDRLPLLCVACVRENERKREETVRMPV
ncbi:hypothetical protein PoB_006456000 [Plakobranchus ocellatus]|uniref:Uncharacterized protein n=1 Tax=Plakobranchus ocellatus TaxID=259542 RepID=A0AAV4D212_9GAST|nr:hypothetical protein PoB_006456000 [Plakobranchus ocellatus]